MLPTHVNGGKRKAPEKGVSFLPTYLRRIIKPTQMDFEYALTTFLLVNLLSEYRYSTKNLQVSLLEFP